MPQGQLVKNFICAGYSFGNSANSGASYEHPNSYEIALPTGKAGTLTTRTDNDTGVATLSAGHGIITSDVCDVYWSGGMRFGMDATVSGNAVTLDGGAGDNLPTQDDPVVVTKQVPFECQIDGDDVQLFGVFLRSSDANAVGHVDFQDSGPATIAELDLVEVDNNGDAMSKAYNFAGGDTNILTGNPIILCAASNGSSTAAATLFVVVGENVT